MASCIRVYASNLNSSGDSLFWAGPAAEELENSLREVGQLDPILVRPEGETYRLLSGYQRVQALSRTGKAILARPLDQDPGPVEDGLLYLHANLHRNPDESMCIMALRYFQPWLSPEDLARRVAPLLGIQPRSATWRRYLAWLRLPLAWDTHLHAGNVSLPAGQILEQLCAQDLEALEPYFQTLKWSQARAMQWLTFLHETALREGLSVARILEESSSLQILEAELSPQDALQRLITRARMLRYPTLTQLEAAFESLHKQLLGSSRWKMTPSSDFESSAVELRLRARSAQDIQAAARDLTETAGAEGWSTLFRLGR